MLTIRPLKVQSFQGFSDAKQGRAVSFHVPSLFWPHTVNILEVIMEENQGYVIRQSVLFDNGRGFVLGEHPREGFVTWQFTQEGSQRDYYWGHYHSDPQVAQADYNDRVEDYQRRYHVREVKAPIAEQIKEADKLAQERQATPAPKKDAPDRGDR